MNNPITIELKPPREHRGRYVIVYRMHEALECGIKREAWVRIRLFLKTNGLLIFLS